MMMNDNIARQIQKEGAEALLDVGVSVPLFKIKIPFIRHSWAIRIKMKRPTLDSQIRIAKAYLSMNVTADELANMPLERQMAFMAEHGHTISRMIALTFCRSFVARRLGVSVMAWVVRNFMQYDYQMAAITAFVHLLGTEAFMPIIRSAERTNPMKLRLSHKKKGS